MKALSNGSQEKQAESDEVTTFFLAEATQVKGDKDGWGGRKKENE